MNYQESTAWLSGLKRYGIKLGLARFHELARLAGDPQKNLRAIHVAGTNGKGSTTTMIAGAMTHGGWKTGLYLSPYVFDLRERIQINGKMISKSRFSELATQARRLVEELEATPFGQATEFEAKTLIGFLYFAEENVDFAAIEVGLGGRLDATNIIVPKVSVITNIFHDHMDKLGKTLSSIAREKAGIIKQGVPVVSGTLSQSAARVILQTSLERAASITQVKPGSLSRRFSRHASIYYRLHERPDGIDTFDLTALGFSLQNIQPRLRGEFQAANAACAAGALLRLREAGYEVGDKDIRAGIENAWLPGRLQVLSEKPFILADGAHNPAGAEAVARYLSSHVSRRPLAVVVGMMASHDPQEVLKHLTPLADWVIATEPPGPGQHPTAVIAHAAGRYGIVALEEPEVNAAIRRARKLAGTEGAVCVTGSFYLIGAIDLTRIPVAAH